MTRLLRVPFHGPDATIIEAATDAYGSNQGIKLLEYIIVMLVNEFGVSALLFHRLVVT